MYTIIKWIYVFMFFATPICAILAPIIDIIAVIKYGDKKKHKHTTHRKSMDMELIRGDNGEFIWLDMRR